MTDKTKAYLVWGILAAAILLPRIALLLNGLDAQRIWDTNTPAAFRLLMAVQEKTLPEFFAGEQKYPLLGSYIHVPVIGAYYLLGRAFGAFDSADAFVDAFALGETSMFFWLRLEMLFLHLGGLILLFLLTKRFAGSLRAGIYALVFAAADFYLVIFSVTPRIHSFAFVATAAALYAAFLLLEEKTLRNYLLAFGAAGAAVAVSQSGFPALILPLLAHGFAKDRMRLNVKHHIREFFLGVALFLFFVLFLGYPRFWLALWNPSELLSVFLAGEHSQPGFGLRQGIRFRLEYIPVAAFAMFWTILSGFWHVACVKKNRRIRLAPYDALAITHILLFAVLFTFSNVMSGRFMLAVLPSFFFLCARVVVALEKCKAFLYALGFLLALQMFGIGLLTMVAAGGDTRSQTAAYVLANTNENDKVLSTLDSELLGIVPAPHSVREEDTGLIARRIKIRDLVGEKTRQITRWRPSADGISEASLADYRFVAVGSDDPERYVAEEILLRNGFQPTATFFATRKYDPRFKSFIAWDMVIPVPRYIPYPIKLRAFRAMGPTVVVYERI